MRRDGFIKIFWGLLFVAVDIRVNSIDLFLPDFVGYILIVKGLGLLAEEHRYFQKARLAAIVMIFVSLPSLIEMKVDAKQGQRIKQQLVSFLTGDLSALLPQEIGSASLLRATSSRSEIDANRTRNPERGENAVLGEYSDGTVVLVLLYPSSEEALLAMEKKAETEYSDEGIRTKAETDESFRSPRVSFPHGESSGGEMKLSAYSNVEVADRVIQQWWNTGLVWWNPSTWQDKAGWSGRFLYIVEGYRSSAASYKSVLEGQSYHPGGITFNPLFPVTMPGEIVNAFLIWVICSGIIALSLSANNDELVNTANVRRTFYTLLTIIGWAIGIILFIVPEPVLNTVASGFIVYAVLELIAMILILGLMRRAANDLDVA